MSSFISTIKNRIINKLPIVFLKKPPIKKLIDKSVILFSYVKNLVELNRYPEIFQDNDLCLVQEVYEYGFNLLQFFYTLACTGIRLCSLLITVK